MTRRMFGAMVGAAVSGMAASVAATRVMAQQDKKAKHVCKGHNDGKGLGGCLSGYNGCAGKNSGKGKGGCATAAHHDCKGMNDCKGQGGCSSGDNGCAAKNSCKGKGGCAVPLKKAKSSLRLRRHRERLA